MESLYEKTNFFIDPNMKLIVAGLVSYAAPFLFF